MAKELCGICKERRGSCVGFRSELLTITVCPTCLMWSADQRADTVRSWLLKTKAARVREGVEITKEVDDARAR